jgi:hypothetical protein
MGDYPTSSLRPQQRTQCDLQSRATEDNRSCREGHAVGIAMPSRERTRRQHFRVPPQRPVLRAATKRRPRHHPHRARQQLLPPPGPQTTPLRTRHTCAREPTPRGGVPVGLGEQAGDDAFVGFPVELMQPGVEAGQQVTAQAAGVQIGAGGGQCPFGGQGGGGMGHHGLRDHLRRPADSGWASR